MSNLDDGSNSQRSWQPRYTDRSDLERESLEAARAVEGCEHLERIEIRYLEKAGPDNPNWIPMRFHPDIPLLTRMEVLGRIKPLWMQWRLRPDD